MACSLICVTPKVTLSNDIMSLPTESYTEEATTGVAKASEAPLGLSEHGSQR